MVPLEEYIPLLTNIILDKIVSTTNNIQQLITILANVDITSHDDNSLKPDHMMQRLVSLPRFTWTDYHHLLHASDADEGVLHQHDHFQTSGLRMTLVRVCKLQHTRE